MKPLVRKESVCIDYERALMLVNDEIAKEGPGYVYPLHEGRSCVNVINQDGMLYGSCLVGRAVIASGIEPGEFYDYSCMDGDVQDIAESIPHLKFTDKAKIFLMFVQQMQDNGTPWGEAVLKGVEHVNSEFNPRDDTRYV